MGVADPELKRANLSCGHSRTRNKEGPKERRDSCPVGIVDPDIKRAYLSCGRD